MYILSKKQRITQKVVKLISIVVLNGPAGHWLPYGTAYLDVHIEVVMQQLTNILANMLNYVF